jgi:hypothetical protein
MPSVILENSGNSNPIIFFGSRSWERVTGKDEEMGWLERSTDRPQVTSGKLVRFMEHIVRHPERVQTIDDNPELDAADAAVAEWIADRLAKLDKVIIKAIWQRREAKTDIGRALNEQKRILGRGNFQSHFSETLGSPISLRTAERYMKLAKKKDAEAKADKLSFLNSASDEGAHSVRSATERAQAAQDKNKSQKGNSPYKLPLVSLDSDDRKAVDALRKTSDWSEAESSIVEEVRRQCIKYGTYGEEDQEENREDHSADA